MISRLDRLSSRHLLLLSFVLLVAAAGGCRGRGNYEATWTLGGVELKCGGDGNKAAVVQCSRNGIDAIQIEALDSTGFARDSSIYPCALCTPAIGPSLEAGSYQMRVTPLAADLLPIDDTNSLRVEISVKIVAGETLSLPIDLIVPKQCMNRVDDDLDGQVDVDDPSCEGDPQGNDESAGNPDGGAGDGGVDGGDAGDAGDAGASDATDATADGSIDADGGPGDGGPDGD